MESRPPGAQQRQSSVEISDSCFYHPRWTVLLFQLSVHQLLWQRGGEITKATLSPFFPLLFLCLSPTWREVIGRTFDNCVIVATHSIQSKTKLYQGRNILSFICTCGQHTRVLQQLSTRAERISQLRENCTLIIDESLETNFKQTRQTFASARFSNLIYSPSLCFKSL